jgi:hypothetical protein
MERETRFWAKFRRLERRVLEGPGSLDAAVRRRAAEGGPLPDPPADRYVQTIHRHAYRIVDRDVQELRESGWSQDQIFELSIAAAFGAARRRLEAGVEALARTGRQVRPARTGRQVRPASAGDARSPDSGAEGGALGAP